MKLCGMSAPSSLLLPRCVAATCFEQQTTSQLIDNIFPLFPLWLTILSIFFFCSVLLLPRFFSRSGSSWCAPQTGGLCLQAKIAECSYLQEAVNAKVRETNQFGEEFNDAARKTEQNCKQACAEYKECRAKTVAAYLQVVGPCETTSSYGGGDCVKNRESDRKSEWETTQTIACLLKHYCDGGHFDEKNVEDCKVCLFLVAELQEEGHVF